MRCLWNLVCLYVPLALMGPVGAQDRPLVLRAVDVADVAAGRIIENQDVVVADGLIMAVEPHSQTSPRPKARQIDLAGLTLIPGLIDLHTHLLLHPYDEASWNDQVLKESLGLRTLRAVPAMRATLAAGFTTIRDLGTEGAGFADVALRDAVEQFIVSGPTILATTRALVATGCYGPTGFAPRWQVPKGAQVADDVGGVRKAVREQIAAGADWIKVYADYQRRPGAAATPTYSQDELNAIVAEATSAGLSVAAHATTNEAIRRAVLAGVRTIEHGTDASAEVLALMREQGVALCPTLAASEAMARYSGWRPGEPDHPRIVRAKALLRRALESGATIACGSDAGVFSHGENARELELLVAYGMQEASALQAATITAAGVLGRSADLGQVSVGFVADLVVIRGNPFEDISSLRSPLIVLKGGEVVVDTR